MCRIPLSYFLKFRQLPKQSYPVKCCFFNLLSQQRLKRNAIGVLHTDWNLVLSLCWWENKLVHPLWKALWQYLLKGPLLSQTKITSSSVSSKCSSLSGHRHCTSLIFSAKLSTSKQLTETQTSL